MTPHSWRIGSQILETASELMGESRTKLAQANSRGLVRKLILEAFNFTRDLGGN